MLKLARDPLVHFLLLGGLIFVLYAWRGDPEGPDPYRIVIPDEEVRSISQALAILNGRTPTEQEMWDILEPNIRDEILFREAVALGLDEGDSLVRARLTEKMLFLTQDIAEPTPPTDQEVAEFFNANPERFREPEKVTFEQVFFSRVRHGEALSLVAEQALERLRADETENLETDESPLDDSYQRATFGIVAQAFGDSFADALRTYEPDNVWHGPLRSDFGMHLVRVSERVESYQPEFDEVSSVASTALTAQRRLEANEAEYQKLRSRYEIIVNLPESPDAAVGVTPVGTSE